MERIDEHEVEFTDDEKKAFDAFWVFLDEGATVPNAAKRAEEQHPGLDQKFYLWLNDEEAGAVGFLPE